VTITLTVTNLGLQNAADVTLDDTLPASFTYLSAVPSQGSCSGGAAVSCNVGALAVDDTATVTIVATTSTAETVNNTASAAGGVADPADPIAANNSATVSVQVGFPSGGGGGCGVIAPIGPSGPTTIAIALLVFFSPLVLAFVRRRAFRA
jgi:uncharacterized repeat protein (TIGR01451 family)